MSERPANPLTWNPLARRGAAVSLLALALLAACGGGGGAGDTSAASSTYALGPITGYGSIVVNGVHYDETKASVTSDDGSPALVSDLKLGVVVEVQGGALDASGTTVRATASRIAFGSELVGQVSAVDVAAGTLAMLDQTVVVSDTTVFDSSLTGGLATVKTRFDAATTAGTKLVLEVHAQFDSATGTYRATRVEEESSASTYKLRGTVASLNTSATTFQIGNAVIHYGGIASASLPANLADGLKVRVRLATARNTAGQWVATSVTTGVRKVLDHAHGHLRGTVGTVTSGTSFTVDGITVDASGATWPDGTSGLVAGARVEVEGTLVNGVLVATKVEFDDHHDRDDNDRNKPSFEGTVDTVDTTAKTFKLVGRTETISYAGVVKFEDGTVESLKPGAKVEVKGRIAGDGTLVARKIEFK